MFFREPGALPKELILIILSNLSVQEAITFLTTSKDMQAQAFVNEDRRWKKFGANSFADLITRISKLPIFFKQAIIDGRYQLPFCEDICKDIYQGSIIAGLKKLSNNTYDGENPYSLFEEIMPEYKAALPPFISCEGMNNSMIRSTTIGFIEKLISPEQMKNLDETAILELFYPNGIKALKNNLITPEYAATVKPSYSLNRLLSELVRHFEAGNDIRLGLLHTVQELQGRSDLSKVFIHYLNNYTPYKGTAEEMHTNEEPPHKKRRKE